jgi:polar amino acid transport system permease protein
MGYTVNFAVVWGSFDKLLSGLSLGLGLAAAAVLIGGVIGLVAGFASVSTSRPARTIASLYVTAFRNLPILVIVLVAYFALPDAGIRFDKYTSFILSLGLYAGAYLAEVFRAGLLSVPKGVIEAGRAIGLTRLQTSMSVVAPIMLRNALPALGSTMISLFKDTWSKAGPWRAAFISRPASCWPRGCGSSNAASPSSEDRPGWMPRSSAKYGWPGARSAKGCSAPSASRSPRSAPAACSAC